MNCEKCNKKYVCKYVEDFAELKMRIDTIKREECFAIEVKCVQYDDTTKFNRR